MEDTYQVLQQTVDELAEKLDRPDLEIETKKIQQNRRRREVITRKKNRSRTRNNVDRSQ